MTRHSFSSFVFGIPISSNVAGPCFLAFAGADVEADETDDCLESGPCDVIVFIGVLLGPRPPADGGAEPGVTGVMELPLGGAAELGV